MYNPPTTTNANQDPKYTVAELLSSLASGEPSMTPTSLAFMSTSGLVTGTTPTLTPTTLRTLESALASVAEDPITTTTTTITSNQRESGFIPPLVDPVATSVSVPMVKQEFPEWYQEESSISEDSEWADSPSVKRARGEGNETYTVTQGYPANVTYAAPGQAQIPTHKTPNRRGGRRINDANLTPEEAHRRNIRRERNKLAAAKCRQRRVDLTNTLINQSEQLEEEQSKLESDIQSLQQQKEQLEFLLEAHRPVCTAKVASNELPVKEEKDLVNQLYATSAVSTATGTILVTPPEAHKNVVATQGLSILNTNISTGGITSRPSTLPIISKNATLSGASVTDATGVPITTPSVGMGMPFTLGLESMMDGHTGLTPITGAPSCASQVHRSSSDTASSASESLSSPTTLMAL